MDLRLTFPLTKIRCLTTAWHQQPELKILYERAKVLDDLADEERSNVRLMQAVAAYQDLIEKHGSKLNDTMFKKIAERCVERLRFVGKLKQAADMGRKLIERFGNDPDYHNQLAVTYLLGNQ